MNTPCTSCGQPRKRGTLADEIGLCLRCIRDAGARRAAMRGRSLSLRRRIDWSRWDALLGRVSDCVVARLAGCSASAVCARRLRVAGPKPPRHVLRVRFRRVRGRAKWSGSTAPVSVAEPRDPRPGPGELAELRERLRDALDHPLTTPHQRQLIEELLRGA